jgi:hypothetical protein
MKSLGLNTELRKKLLMKPIILVSLFVSRMELMNGQVVTGGMMELVMEEA